MKPTHDNRRRKISLIGHVIPSVFLGFGLLIAIMVSLPVGIIVAGSGLAIGAVDQARYEITDGLRPLRASDKK
jgi:hypothetical protein